MTRFALLLAALLLVACGPRHPERDPTCEGACLHMLDLGCPEAGGACVEWCSYYARTPAGVDPVCMARAPTCDDVERCGR